MKTTTRRSAIGGAAAIAVLGLLLPTTPTQAEVAERTPNIDLVTNLPYALQEYPQGTAFAYDPTTRSGGTDIELTTLVVDGMPRDYAVAGSYRNGLQLIDVTDPQNPVITDTYECGIAQGDVQVFSRGGRTYAAYAQDDIESDALYTTTCFQEGFALHGITTPTNVDNARVINEEGGGLFGTFIVDITDPRDPFLEGWARWRHGSHNSTVSPDGMWLLNSNQDLIARTPVGGQAAYQIEVFSLADLSAPAKAFDIPLTTGAGPHDITFNPDGTRAYVAAVSHTVILDTSGLSAAAPSAPQVIGIVEDPSISIHHQADPLPVGDKEFLVISDELAGVIEGSVACPGGGLHIYDVTGGLETTPVKVGLFEINQVLPPGQDHARCTAHVFRAYPEQGIMTIAWYGAGVRVLDYSGLANLGLAAGLDPDVPLAGQGIREIASFWFPQTDAQVGSQAWAAKIHHFEDDGSAYIFANDLDRGFDVFKWDGTAYDGNPGSFLDPEGAAALALERGVGRASVGQSQALPICVVLPE